MDELAKQDHTYQAKSAPMRLRQGFRAAVSLENRLHRESGEEIEEPIFPQQCRRWHSSSSDSWWDWDTSQSWWSSWYFFLMRMKWLRSFLFCYNQFRLQSMAIHCNRRGVYTETPHTSFLLLHSAHTGWCTLTSWLKNVCAHHPILMVTHVVRSIVCSLTLCSSPGSFPCVSLIPCSFLSTSTCTLSWTSSSMWTTPRKLTIGTLPTEESGHLAEFTLSEIDDLNNVVFFSNVNSSRKEALLYIFEDNEVVMKMIIKGRSPAMRHVPRTHRVALDWLFHRINLDPKIQIRYIDTKNQLADILTKGNFTRDEWTRFLCLFNISHFSSINSLESMSKRTQEDASEERVTAKSKPMMNLVSRYRVRDPNVLASTASESLGNTKSESQTVHLWARSMCRKQVRGDPFWALAH